MVLCYPFKNWKGIQWFLFEDKKDEIFILQYNR